MADSTNVNMLVNSAYQASVVAGFMLANSWAMKRFLKIKPVNLSQLDVEDAGKLTLSVMGATWIPDYLVKQGIIPENIINENRESIEYQ